MKRSGTTLIFVIVWASVLFASYVIGICIKEVRFKHAKIDSQAVTEPEVSNEVQEPGETDPLLRELAQRRPMPGPEGMMGERNISPEDRAGFGEGRRGMREQLENMSEEEREQFRTQMRERFAGRRRGGDERLQNLSEEDRARLREEMEELRGRWEQMSEEEREEARSQISERYGFVPRIGMDGGQGGNRGPGDGEGGRRRQGGRRQENN
ncbi:MAG TPA: hypothetical protein VMW72_22215 [Sedimentisphaerales bacterium]|nr:hypothetical protein [Sedimentisphaerales bacterium]